MFVPPSSGGFGNTFTTDRHFIADVRLVPLPGAAPGASPTWGVYDFEVVLPEPGIASLMMLATISRVIRRTRQRRR